MPIRGLTDRAASFPRIGELRKGAEKPERGPGRDLTYFRFTSENQDALQRFTAVYGDQPQAINVFLPYKTTDENFEAWIEEWGAGSLKWRGDGENLVIWQQKDGTYSQEPKPQPQTGGNQVGRLKVIIPELGRLAYVMALTTSTHDIIELHANLTAYEALRGTLQGIPFILSRVPRMISTPGKNGKRVRREKWLLHIEAAPEWVQAQLSVMQQDALPTVDEVLSLTDGTDEIIEQTEPTQYHTPFEDGKGNDMNKDADMQEEWGEGLAHAYSLGASVTVKGKHDEKPGTIKGYSGDLIIVTIEGKDFTLSPDKVTVVEE